MCRVVPDSSAKSFRVSGMSIFVPPPVSCPAWLAKRSRARATRRSTRSVASSRTRSCASFNRLPTMLDEVKRDPRMTADQLQLCRFAPADLNRIHERNGFGRVFSVREEGNRAEHLTGTDEADDDLAAATARLGTRTRPSISAWQRPAELPCSKMRVSFASRRSRACFITSSSAAGGNSRKSSMDASTPGSSVTDAAFILYSDWQKSGSDLCWHKDGRSMMS